MACSRPTRFPLILEHELVCSICGWPKATTLYESYAAIHVKICLLCVCSVCSPMWQVRLLDRLEVR
jgi:hypothetical protein